jgi:hypothetical protein
MTDTETYRPGNCNIGPAEIRMRRRSGHAGVAATVALLGLLVLLPIAPLWRLLLFFPAAGAAMGYLQATLRFCAAFGWRGVFNVGDRVGETREVADRQARRQDRTRALRLTAAAAVIGMAVALLALLI